jgi:hypothetical protein
MTPMVNVDPESGNNNKIPQLVNDENIPTFTIKPLSS